MLTTIIPSSVARLGSELFREPDYETLLFLICFATDPAVMSGRFEGKVGAFTSVVKALR